MSVLVEALSLIVPRQVLDISYPGGTEAFIHKMCEPAVRCRLVCTDDELVSASFACVKEAKLAGSHLMAHGIVEVDDDRFHGMAFVNQDNGLEIPCDWIEWRKHPDGYSYCWLAGSDPSPLHVPANWTPEQSRNLTFHYFHDEPGRCLKLAEEDGREIWLDFQTGDIESLPLHPHEIESAEDSVANNASITIVNDGLFLNSDGPSGDEGGKLMSIVRAVLDGYGYRYQQPTAEALMVTIRNERATYTVFFSAMDETDLVKLVCSYGSRVPEDRHVAMAEAMSRINAGIWLGNFEMDFADGELRFRISMDVEEGLLSEKMVDNMFACAFHTHGALSSRPHACRLRRCRASDRYCRSRVIASVSSRRIIIYVRRGVAADGPPISDERPGRH